MFRKGILILFIICCTQTLWAQGNRFGLYAGYIASTFGHFDHFENLGIRYPGLPAPRLGLTHTYEFDSIGSIVSMVDVAKRGSRYHVFTQPANPPADISYYALQYSFFGRFGITEDWFILAGVHYSWAITPVFVEEPFFSSQLDILNLNGTDKFTPNGRGWQAGAEYIINDYMGGSLWYSMSTSYVITIANSKKKMGSINVGLFCRF